MKLQLTPNRTTSHSASSFHFPKLPVDTKVFASKLLKKFRAFLFASFAFPSISIQPPASTLFLSPVYSPDSRRSAILWYRPGGLTRSKTRLKNLDRALQSLLVVMSQIWKKFSIRETKLFDTSKIFGTLKIFPSLGIETSSILRKTTNVPPHNVSVFRLIFSDWTGTLPHPTASRLSGTVVFKVGT